MIDDLQGEVSIVDESHIITVRKSVREVATRLGFGLTDVTRIITAASELARNIYHYAGKGVMHWRVLDTGTNTGIELTFIDHGPGIPDLDQVMQEGYSTSGGLGMGLPGSKRLMDEFEIKSTAGLGTTVTVKKWKKK
jgi:serine/threonine-protein kinase RsbT